MTTDFDLGWNAALDAAIAHCEEVREDRRTHPPTFRDGRRKFTPEDIVLFERATAGSCRVRIESLRKMEATMGDCGIGWAVAQMLDGKKVRRAGWNGKGMFIVLMPELKLPPHSTQAPGAKVNDRTAKHIGVDTPLDSQPYIAMFTAQGKWQPGWLCSQADLLATDWEIAA